MMIRREAKNRAINIGILGVSQSPLKGDRDGELSWATLVLVVWSSYGALDRQTVRTLQSKRAKRRWYCNDLLIIVLAAQFIDTPNATHNAYRAFAPNIKRQISRYIAERNKTQFRPLHARYRLGHSCSHYWLYGPL